MPQKIFNMANKFKTKEIQPDPIYGDILVSKFINQVMKKGKKSVARKIVYDAFELIKKQTKENPVDILNKALENAAPVIEVRPKRVGGATYQIPKEVKGKRRMSLAMRWIAGAAKGKKGKAMVQKLAEELILASKNEGESIKKKINLHRIADANKAFAYLSR